MKEFKYKLFGRFKGRKKIDLFSDKSLKDYKLNIKADINKKEYNILDIGSGSGENTVHLSKHKKKSKIIACEVFTDGNINLCNKIIKNKIDNINIFEGNVLELLDNINLSAVFDEIWILFPDPWPKNRHHKRRLINKPFLFKIHSFLKKNGNLMIATDSASYMYHIVKSIYGAQKKYHWVNQRFDEWNYYNLPLPQTKFYKKALKSNRNSMFFKLNKI